MGIIRLYNSDNRIRTKRMHVRNYQVFYYPEFVPPKCNREIFVHRGSGDGIFLSRHLQTGALYFTTHELADVLIIGEADPKLESTITWLLQEVRNG